MERSLLQCEIPGVLKDYRKVLKDYRKNYRKTDPDERREKGGMTFREFYFSPDFGIIGQRTFGVRLQPRGRNKETNHERSH